MFLLKTQAFATPYMRLHLVFLWAAVSIYSHHALLYTYIFLKSRFELHLVPLEVLLLAPNIRH